MLGSTLRVFNGLTLVPFFDPAGQVAPQMERLYRFDLTTPSLTPPSAANYQGIDISNSTGANKSPQINEAFVVEGVDGNEQLANALNIGDFNGDGRDDFMVYGRTKAYVFFGPFTALGLELVTSKADHIIDLTTFGKPADRAGDVNADGFADLAFSSYSAATLTTTVTIFSGGTFHLLPRTLGSVASLDARYTRQIALSGTEINGATAKVILLNYLGRVNPANGRSYSDVAVVSETANGANIYGYIFSGRDLPAYGTAVSSIGSAHAAKVVDLQLFTTVVSTGTINQPVPTFYRDQSTEVVPTTPSAFGQTVANVSINPTRPTTLPTVSSTVYYSITDYSTINSSISISADSLVADVNVVVNLTHTYTGDLAIWLISPNGTMVQLFNRRGGGGDNMSATTFDDEAGTLISSGSAPFTGSFRPEAPLSAFDGATAKGTWTPRISDLAGWTPVG